MKAKIKPLIILIAVFAVSLIAGIAAGCSIGEINGKQQAENMGYTAAATYYANGGTFRKGTDADGQAYMTILYRPDTPIYEIYEGAPVGSNITIYRTNYVFTGWEYCVLDDDGNPVLKDEEGNILPVLDNGTADIKSTNGLQQNEKEKRFTSTPNGEKVFTGDSVTLNEGEHIYLAATWEEDIRLEYKLVTDTPITVGEVTYETGDVIHTQGFGSGTITLNPGRFNPTANLGSTHSFLHFYYDEECEQPVEDGAKITKPEEKENPVIYARYREGKWTAVRDSGDVTSMLNTPTAGNYFIVGDIDCTNQANFSMKSGRTFNHVIDGNNCTISNITVQASNGGAQQLSNGQTYSLLGALGESASITNLTFENVNIKTQIANGNVTIFTLLESINENAVLNNFKVDGVSLSVTYNTATSMILNIQNVEGSFQTGNWLYGAYSSDEEFTERYGEIVQNATLTINNEQVIGGQQ